MVPQRSAPSPIPRYFRGAVAARLQPARRRAERRPQPPYPQSMMRGGAMNEIHIGTMGWSYPDWVGPFYPAGARPANFLAEYARVFDCVELDTTFYGIP